MYGRCEDKAFSVMGSWNVKWSYGGMLELMDSDVLEQLLAGEVEGMRITHELLLFMAILMIIPPIMVFLSVTLKDSVNRWANIIFGIVFVGFGLFEMVSAKPAYGIFVGIVGLVFSALIVWYASKWKV